MPQGRRKTPFSGKAKKEQLKLKKQRQGLSGPFLRGRNTDEAMGSTNKFSCDSKTRPDSKSNRYALMFHKQTDEEVRQQKEIARQSLTAVPESGLEIDANDFYPVDLDFPKRPQWSYELTKEQLDARENRYFTEYIKEIEQKYSYKEISYFEMNLETWRQLWRVLEMSDIILYIVDIRFSAMMFPPAFYEYVVKEIKKQFILVLNKIDLAPAPLVVAWKSYFEEKYPQIHIVMFTTLPSYNLVENFSEKKGLQNRRRKGKLRMAAEGTQVLLEVCKSIVGSEVDLSSWEMKIRDELNFEGDDEKTEVDEIIDQKTVDTSFFEHEKYKNGILTIGCVGQPNVGKSSLMNAVKGKKIVSVSKTPGHTKHFQTIFLTPNVRLCDCPGLVFPSKVPKTIQILMGSYPIAQLREPYTTVKYLAERMDLIKLLAVQHPENDDVWSAMDICDGWAKKRGYLTAKAARLDSYRSANSLLRMALDGKICLCLRPPGYSARKDFWSAHPEVQKVLWIQAKSDEENVKRDFKSTDDSDVSDIEDSPKFDSDVQELSSEEQSSAGEDEETEEDSDNEIDMMTNKFAALQE